jgi:hypothetical protein
LRVGVVFVFKRVLVLILCIVILVYSVSFADGVGKGFKDVSAKHWANKFITKLTELGYLKGYTDGTFKPDRPVLRSEFVSIFVNVMNIHVKDDIHLIYEDVKYNDWFIKNALAADRYLPGYSINNKYYFKPNEPIKREDVAAALVRYYNYDIGIKTNELDSLFSDSFLISHHLRGHVLQAYKNGIMLGSNGKFNPRQSMTRAEIATLFYRILEKEGRLNTSNNQASGGGTDKLKNEWYKDKNDVISKYDPNKIIEITDEMIKNNLVENYSFEDYTTFADIKDAREIKKRGGKLGWIITNEEYSSGIGQLTSDDKISGKNSAYFIKNLYQSNIGPLKPDTDYTLIGYFKRTKNSSLTVHFSTSAESKAMVNKQINAQKINEWEQFVYRFKTGIKKEFAYVGFMTSDFSYVDDIILVETDYIKDKSILPKMVGGIEYGPILIEPVEIEYIFPQKPEPVAVSMLINDRFKIDSINTLDVGGETYYDAGTLKYQGVIEIVQNKHQYCIFTANGDILIVTPMSNEYILNGEKGKTKLPVFTYIYDNYGVSLFIPETILDKLTGDKFIKKNENGILKCNFPLGKINKIEEVTKKWWINDRPSKEYYYPIINDDWSIYNEEMKYLKEATKSEYWNIKGILYTKGTTGKFSYGEYGTPGGLQVVYMKNYNISLNIRKFSNCYIKYIDKRPVYILYTMITLETDYGDWWYPAKFKIEQLDGSMLLDKEAGFIYYYIDLEEDKPIQNNYEPTI